MARGGFRLGAGRPKTQATLEREARKAARESAKAAAPEPVVKAEPVVLLPGTQTPLEYMLGVMNDPVADDARRDRMAVAAAAFVHLKAADVAPGKKKESADIAKAAAASGGKFAPPAAPKLVVSNNK